MPPDGRDPADPHEWLRRARSNLARARADHGLRDVLYEDLCFDAQQTAEKALKAHLVHLQTEFPKTHDIVDLLTIVQKVGIEVSDEILEADALTGYAVEARYPGMAEDVDAAEYERVLQWVQDLLTSPLST